LSGVLHCSEENSTLSKNGDDDQSGEDNQTQTQSQVIPDNYSLSQNYPNPFNPTTYISFGLPEAAFVTLKIYDLLGNEIATLVNDNISAGMHNVAFDASSYPSGVYLYKIQAGTFIVTKKMVLLK
jgi:hypothetical protein